MASLQLYDHLRGIFVGEELSESTLLVRRFLNHKLCFVDGEKVKSFFSCDSVTHSGKSNTWFTPKYFFDALGEFDLDPCTESFRPFDTAKTHFEHDKGQDGLAPHWEGRVWLNPPYGNFTRVWLTRLREHGNGIALVFTAFETTWGQEAVKTSDGIYLLAGRVSFIDQNGVAKNNAGKGSCLVVYGKENLESVKKLKGVLVKP